MHVIGNILKYTCARKVWLRYCENKKVQFFAYRDSGYGCKTML